MKKKILFILEGDISHPSTRIRVLQFIPLLKKSNNFKLFFHKRVLDFDFTILGRLKYSFVKWYSKLTRPLIILIRKFDIVFVQRVFLNRLELWILNKRNTYIIYDVDDAIFLNNRTEFNLNIRKSDHIIVSTPYLIDEIKGFGVNYSLIYSSVDSHVENNNINNGRIVIGWTGSESNLKYVNSIIEQIIILLDTFPNLEFWYISSVDIFSNLHSRIKFYNWDIEIEKMIIPKFSIGIMPLSLDQWERYKGGYKLFVYLMNNVPIIGTSIGLNEKIIQDRVNGRKVFDNKDWYNIISETILNNEISNFRTNILNSEKKDFDLYFNYKRLEEILINNEKSK